MTSTIFEKTQRCVWKLALRLPFSKSFFLIVNCYVWMGDPQAFIKFAPMGLYLKRVVSKIIVVAIASYALIKYGQLFYIVKPSPLNTLDVSLQLFPNVLGFGIGAYALLFSFPERFFSSLETASRDKSQRIGAQGLNAIMAFPLMMIAVIILLAAIIKILKIDENSADIWGIFLVVYGMLLTMELIGVLFGSESTWRRV